MPFRSRSQARMFFAKEHNGELPPGTALRWAHETPDFKKLPDRVRSKRKPTNRSKVAHMLKAALGIINPGEMQRQQIGQQQMSAMNKQPPSPMGLSPQAMKPPGSPTGGLGSGGYGAASALGPPALSGKLGNGPGVGANFGGQTAGGVKVGELRKAAAGLFSGLTAPGGLMGPPAKGSTPVQPHNLMSRNTVMGSAVGPTGKKNLGVGYSQSQANNNAMYGQAGSPGFAGMPPAPPMPPPMPQKPQQPMQPAQPARPAQLPMGGM